MTWASFKDTKNTCAGARRFLRLLGYRATAGSRQDITGRACVMATQIGAGFETVFPAFTFPAVILARQIVAWFTCLNWPKALDAPMHTLDRALTEYLRIHRYEMGTVAQQAVFISEVFDRVLQKCKALQQVAGEAAPSDVFDSLRSALPVYDIPITPLYEYWLTLAAAVAHLEHLVLDKGTGAAQLTSRVMVLLDDKKQEKRAVGQGDLPHVADAASKSTGNLTGYSGRISSTSLNELRRSAELLDVVKRVKRELERPTPSQSAIFDICLPSRLSGVVRFITGVIPTLHVADVFAVELTHYRVRRLHADFMAGLCKHLWLKVFDDEVAEFPRVKEATFHPHFVKDLSDLLLSNWTAIDFE